MEIQQFLHMPFLNNWSFSMYILGAYIGFYGYFCFVSDLFISLVYI